MAKEDLKIPVGISSCITGENVRYDGGNKYDPRVIEHLGKYFDLRGFCPEVEAGLGVPRETIQLVYKNKKIRAVGVKDPDRDVTRALKKAADKNSATFEPLCGYILKARSPSCGMYKVPVFKSDKQKGEGSGIFAQRLMKTYPCLPVEESERLENPEILENFVLRVFVMEAWKQLLAEKLTPKRLLAFHNQFKYLILSHRADSFPQLDRMAKSAKKKGLRETAQEYITLLMRTLRVRPSRKCQARVMQTLADELAPLGSKEETKDLSKAIEKFKKGDKPKDKVLKLLQQLADKLDESSPAIERYLAPYPAPLINEFAA